jgi:hypothetical protein
MRVIIGVLATLLASGPAEAQQLKLAREIGQASGPSEYTLNRVTAIAVDSLGNTYVADGGDKIVRVYGPDGRFQRNIGHSGSGPGEFEFPVRIRLRGNGVEVTDARLSRVSVFDRSGEHVSTTPLAAPAGLALSEMIPLRDGMYLGVTIFRASPGQQTHDPYVRTLLLRSGSLEVDTLATQQADAAIWADADGGSWGVVPTTLGQGGAVAVSGDSVLALVDGADGSARLFRITGAGLELSRRVDLGVRSAPTTSDDRRTLEAQARRTRNLPRRLRWDVPPLFSAVTGASFFASTGELWVELNRRDADRDHEWLVISPSGSISKVGVPSRLKLKAAVGATLYGVWTGDLDVQTVRIYEWAR